MKLVHIQDVQRPEAQGIFAKPLLEGEQSNVRIIRLAPGQALPPHRHADSDLMLYLVSGEGMLYLAEGACPSRRAHSRSIVVTRSYAFAIRVQPNLRCWRFSPRNSRPQPERTPACYLKPEPDLVRAAERARRPVSLAWTKGMSAATELIRSPRVPLTALAARRYDHRQPAGRFKGTRCQPARCATDLSRGREQG